jgi:hypothetical protein
MSRIRDRGMALIVTSARVQDNAPSHVPPSGAIPRVRAGSRAALNIAADHDW